VLQCCNQKSPSLSLYIYDLKKTFFLAYRLDDTGKVISASLGTFLRRLGFDVSEGSGYEARDIPENVADNRISSSVWQPRVICPGF
jgi:hypothetical protein